MLEFRRHGCVVVQDLIPEFDLVRLRQEALRMRPGAMLKCREEFALTDDGRVLGPAQSLGAVGPVLGSVAESRDMCSKVVQATGIGLAPARPSRASYLYYRRDDYIALHRDLPSCQVTALIWLGGPAGRLRVHPELIHVADRELLARAIDSGGHLGGGELIDLHDGALVLAGNAVPHSRRPHPYDTELVMVALSFATKR